MSKEINFNALTGEIWDKGFQKNQKTFKKAEDVAEKIYKKIRGKACFLIPCGNSVIEARISDNFDENYKKRSVEEIKEIILKFREKVEVV